MNYRGWDALKECLDSINSILSTSFNYEVIVIDNYSNDGKLFEFQSLYPKFTFIENSGNNGFANGCNLGAKNAKGKYFFFLNPDTKLTLQALETLLKTAINNPEIGILSCSQINENNKYYNQQNLFPAIGRIFGISRAIYKVTNKSKLKSRFNTESKLFYPDWVTGAVIFMNKNWYTKINGWNEDYWMYYEDVDLCKRIKDNNGKIAVTKETTIFHKHGGASRINIVTKALTKTEVIISKHVYIKTHFSKFIGLYLNIIIVFSQLFEKSMLSFLSFILFFNSKLKVNRLIFKNLLAYYFNVLSKQTWLSKRSINYKV